MRKTGEQIQFDTLRNIRDLGGYRAADGRHVRYGVLLRGPALCGLSGEDIRKIDSMKLKTLFDLRSQTEAAANPEYIPDGCGYLRECASIDRYGNEIDFSPGAIENITHKFITLFRLIRGMVNNDIYDCMPFSNPAFRQMFALLSKPDTTPMYFHCAAGKDRTGIAAILILMMLGVSEQDALDDYELTNVYYADRIAASLKRHRLICAVSKTARARFTAGQGVSRAAAEHAIRLIYDRYGTFESYLLQEYGIDAGMLAALRDRYLE